MVTNFCSEAIEGDHSFYPTYKLDWTAVLQPTTYDDIQGGMWISRYFFMIISGITNRVDLECVLRADLYYSCGPSCCDEVKESGLNNKTDKPWIGEAPRIRSLEKKNLDKEKNITIHFCEDEKKKKNSTTSACLELTILDCGKEKIIREVFQLPNLKLCHRIPLTAWKIACISISGTLNGGCLIMISVQVSWWALASCSSCRLLSRTS